MIVGIGVIGILTLFLLVGLYPVVVCGKDKQTSEVVSSAKTTKKEEAEESRDDEKEDDDPPE